MDRDGTESSNTLGGALAEVRALVTRYRARCLWFLARDFSPTNVEEALRALSYLERYGDRAAFVKAKELRVCLSRNSSDSSSA